jgi:glycosyltransferase involved in cell wall biosynthesis
MLKARLRKPLGIWQNFCMHYPLRAANRLIALSRHEVSVLQRLGIASARIVRLPLWIDVAYIDGVATGPSVAEQYSSPHLLFLGQLKERKGYDTLAHAMPQVLERYPTASFLFAGQNPANAEHLIEICHDNGSEGSLVLLGKVSEEDKVRLMRSSDCLIYPTRYESFGLPPLEAMAAGCPVIASDLPVVSEMIEDGYNGILVEPESPSALASAIIGLLSDSSLRARLVAGGRATLGRYSEERIIADIERVYTYVMRKSQ